MTLVSLSACVVTNEAVARHSTQIFHVLCIMLLRSIEIQGHRLVKQENYSPKRKTDLLVETFCTCRRRWRICRRRTFVFGGDGEFDAEVVMIKRPNLELARWRCPGAVDLGGRDDTRVIGGRDRDN